MEQIDPYTHLAVMTTSGMIEIQYYTDYVKWIFNNELMMNIMRSTWVWTFLIAIPAACYSAYRIYWWTLSTEIWVPNVNK